jgi:Glycosyl hydrolase family 26
MPHEASFTLAITLSLSALFSSQCGSNKKENKSGQTNTAAVTTATAQATPTPRTLYHGVHPGSATGKETDIGELADYERAIGQKAAFVYFTQELNKEWLDGTDRSGPPVFPGRQVDDIRGHDAIPVIRLMIRESDEQNKNTNLETIYSYDVLLDGPLLPGEKQTIREKFRQRILAWGREAAARHRPIYVEWGTEVNGKWFWWNAKWYAKEQCTPERRGREKEDACLARKYKEGTEKFKEVYQHLRQLINVEAGASNVKWIFHVTASGEPDPSENSKNLWNGMENYYPGSDYVDAIGVSVYGAQTKKEGCDGQKHSFAEQMDQIFLGKDREDGDSLKDVATGKKVFVLEFGETLIVGKSEKKDSNCNAGKWAKDALQAMFDPNAHHPGRLFVVERGVGGQG